MKTEAQKLLIDILNAVTLIIDFTRELENYAAYQKDFKTKSAVDRQLIIIGEAANKLKKDFPEIEISNTRQIINLRNRITHAYDSIDDSIVWLIVKQHLPELLSGIEQLLKKK